MESLSINQLELLQKSNNTIEPFSLAKRKLFAKVVDVYDGDTCKVNLFLHDCLLKKFTIRMIGYDSPELRTKNPIEKKYGHRSKDVIVKLIADKIVKLECLDFDKYGRILGQIYIHDNNQNEINVNNFMIHNHLGYSYMGDTKTNFDSLLNSGYYKEENIVVPVTQSYKIITIESKDVLSNSNQSTKVTSVTKKKSNNYFCLFC